MSLDNINKAKFYTTDILSKKRKALYQELKKLKQRLKEISKYLIRNELFRPTLRFLGKRKILPKEIWRRLQPEDPFKIKFNNRLFIYDPTKDDQIAKKLFWRGLNYWEKTPLKFH